MHGVVQPAVRWVTDVAQCEQRQIPFGHLLKTVWTGKCDTNQSRLQPERSLSRQKLPTSRP